MLHFFLCRVIGLVIRRYSIHIYDILYISMIQGINCDLDPDLDRRKWKETSISRLGICVNDEHSYFKYYKYMMNQNHICSITSM